MQYGYVDVLFIYPQILSMFAKEVTIDGVATKK